MGQYDVVVNCTGFRSRDLVGDKAVYPVRGHLIKVSEAELILYASLQSLNIMLLNRCFHIGPVRGPLAVALACGLLYWPEAKPKANTTIRRPIRLAEDLWQGQCENIHFITFLFINFLISTLKVRRPRWLIWMRRPTGDQEVASQPPPWSATFFRGDWSWNIFFLRSFSPFPWFKKGSCQFLAKECAQYWLTA